MRQAAGAMGWRAGARILGAGLGLLAGCASPGLPRAPSLQLPEKVATLEAQRVGDEVMLRWTTPANTTDGERIRGAVTAVPCREVVPAQGGCVALGRMSVTPGPAEYVDKLPPALAGGAPRLLSYRVELRNAKDRSAGESDGAWAAAGQAPAAAGALTLTPRRGAALIRWTPQDGEGNSSGDAPHAAMEVTRTTSAGAPGKVSGSAPAPVAGPRPARPRGLKTQLPGQGRASPRAAGEVLLTDAQPSAGTATNPGAGMLDRGVRDGETYLYRAQRVQHVTLQGHALELRGLPSPAATLRYQDTFPPRAPQGLAAAQAGVPGQTRSIDLSWEPNDEDDLLGYNIYRALQGAGDTPRFERLNAQPVRDAAYRDMTVTPGRRYSYRVTAVDAHGNESAPGVEVQELVRE